MNVSDILIHGLTNEYIVVPTEQPPKGKEQKAKYLIGLHPSTIKIWGN